MKRPNNLKLISRESWGTNQYFQKNVFYNIENLKHSNNVRGKLEKN